MEKRVSTDSENWVIGIDESNNGTSLKNFNNNHGSDLVFAGYLAIDKPIKNSTYNRPENEVKGKLFNGNRNLEEAKKRARSYLNGHIDFLYTTIPEDVYKSTPNYDKYKFNATSVALIVINFFLRYDLKVDNTRVILDCMGGKEPNRHIIGLANSYLEIAGLRKRRGGSSTGLEIRAMKSSPSHVLAVRKADHISYYIAALHLLGDSTKPPYRNHRLNLKSLDKNVIELRNEL